MMALRLHFRPPRLTQQPPRGLYLRRRRNRLYLHNPQPRLRRHQQVKLHLNPHQQVKLHLNPYLRLNLHQQRFRRQRRSLQQ